MIQKVINVLNSLRLLAHPQARDQLLKLVQRQQIENSVRRDCPKLKLKGDVLFIGYQKGQLVIQDTVKICHGSILAFAEDDHGHGRIEIGSGTWIGEYNNFRSAGNGRITIGSDCLISQFCSFISHNHRKDLGTPINKQPNDYTKQDILIGDDVWIGASCVILPGANIGTGAVIGANSTLSQTVSENEIWAGSPARKIGQRK